MKTLHTINANFAKRMFVSLMALMTIGITSVFGVEYVEKLSVTSNDIMNSAGQGSGYRAYSCTIDEVGWLITHGGSGSTGSPIGTNSGNRSNCNLSSYPQYAVAPVKTGDLASVFVNTTPINNVSKISYTCTYDEESATTNVYLIYSSDGTNFIQMPLSTDNQGANIYSGMEYTFAECSGYFGLLFLGKTNSGDWRVQNVSITFYGYSGTPPTHKVTWEVNGDVYHTEYVVENNRVTMPDIPTNDCGDKTFVGWTTGEVSEGNGAPQILFEASAQYPAITEETTFYAVFADLDNTSAGTITDNITATLTGIPNNAGYKDWTNKQSNSDAVYAGKSNNSNAIVIRDNENTSNTGIITLKSGGKAKKVIIEWNAATSGDDRKLQVYGKRTPYESVADIHNPNKQGALLGLIDYDKKQTTLEISGNYEYIGFSSFTGALLINKVSIEWESEGSYSGYTTSCTPKYTVTLDPNGGDGGDYTGWTENVGNYTKRINENTSVDLPIPTKSGYYFDGWYHNSTKVSSPYIVTEDVTLTANWITLTNFRTSCSYTVTWQANGGQWSDGKTEDIEEEYNVGETITPPDDPTRDGYTFAGWEPEVPATMPAEDQTFKAIWENCRWVETTTIEDGDEIVFIMVDNEKSTSYAMDNKETSSNPLAVVINTDIFSSGNVPNNIIWDIQKDADGIVFYSKTAAEKSIFCITNYIRVGVGANNTFTLDEGYIQSLSYDDSYLAVATGAATTKYWRQYAYSSNNITNQTLKLYKRICLDDTKHWVTWDANGGLFADGSATKTDFFTVGAPITHPANPTREGYTFTGWSPTTSTVGDEDITFVAQWQVNTYTVTWNANGGKFGNETSVVQSYPYGATITAPDAPTRVGYTFADWNPAPAATMPASNLTYNAQWTCTSPTDIKINGEYIRFPGETIELTVTGNNIADDATYQWFKKKGDSYDVLEEQTTNTLRIDNCVVGDAANYKCVVTNGTCSAESNYTVKMYRLRGLTDNTWNTEFVFSKDNADDKTAILHVDLAANTTYEFKLNDGSVWYWNEGTMTHNQCTDWLIEQEGEDTQGKENTKITTTILGTYIFTLDYSDASKPLLSVIYPQKKIIYLDPGIWKADNAKFVVHAWTDGVDNGKDILMTRVDDCNKERIIYQAEIEASHDRIIFVRCNPDGFNINDIWSKEWNRTNTLWLTIPENQFNIEAWGEGGTVDGKTCSKGSWSNFIQFYTISYNMNGHGTQIADDCVEDGHAWDAPTDPTAVGYTFLGWRRPATTNDNTLYKYGQTGFTPTANEELTAQWSFSMEYAITGTANVTSAVGQTIKATTPLQLAVSNMPEGTKVAISAPNITFYDEAGNAITEVATKYNPEQFNLTIAYTPTVENTTEQPTITLSVLGNEKTFDGHISARSLPNTFAIVAKVGNLWYALPSQGLNSTDDLMGYAIEVDNQNNPTLVTSVPANADWSLCQVYKSTGTDDRFGANGDNILFVNGEGKALNASRKDGYVLTDAKYDSYQTTTSPDLYEWIPTTTDLETYQLTNANRTDRKLSIDILTRFGVYAGEITDMRFLPIQNRYTQAALQVVEWKENSVVIMYNGDPAQTATLAIDGTTNIGSANLSDVNKDFAIYELPADGLVNNATKRILITIGTEQKWLTIPYIISGEKTDAEVVASTNADIVTATDVFILKGAKFSATATSQNSQCRFRNVTVYGGGKLVIGSGTFLSMNSIILRAGGITDAGEYDYVYPQFDLQGTLTNSAGEFKYDYITDNEHWYHLVLPFDGKIKSPSIKYPVEFYGSNVATTNTGSWIVKRYDGATRSTGNYNAWVDIETEGAESITAGKGYIYWGAPKKVTVNGDTQRQKWGIQRIVMSKGAEKAKEAENANKTISGLGSYENVANNSDNVYDQGWNLIGNPYMVNLTGLNSRSLKAGQLIEELDANGNWTGGWVLDSINATLRYITVPSDHFEWYTAEKVSKNMTLVAGRAFFVQIDGTATDVMFEAANRAQLMPALRAAHNDEPVDIETGIVLSNETLQDEVNFWIKDGKTNDYEYNADYPKTPNNNNFNIYGVHTNGHLSWVATGPEYAAESMPIGYQVPAAGTYMLSVSEEYYSDEVDALLVTDHEMSPEVTTDLMITSYEFSVNQAETNNKRFTVAIKLKNGDNNDATGLDNLGIGNEHLMKFIYQDKIYILHHGVIYDATGKRVITINK